MTQFSAVFSEALNASKGYAGKLTSNDPEDVEIHPRLPNNFTNDANLVLMPAWV